MNRRKRKVELFEQIRREYEHGAGTIKGVARKLGVHRRMVREAIGNAMPKPRKVAEREKTKMAAVMRGSRRSCRPIKRRRENSGTRHIGSGAG